MASVAIAACGLPGVGFGGETRSGRCNARAERYDDKLLLTGDPDGNTTSGFYPFMPFMPFMKFSDTVLRQ